MWRKERARERKRESTQLTKLLWWWLFALFLSRILQPGKGVTLVLCLGSEEKQCSLLKKYSEQDNTTELHSQSEVVMWLNHRRQVKSTTSDSRWFHYIQKCEHFPQTKLFNAPKCEDGIVFSTLLKVFTKSYVYFWLNLYISWWLENMVYFVKNTPIYTLKQ